MSEHRDVLRLAFATTVAFLPACILFDHSSNVGGSGGADTSSTGTDADASAGPGSGGSTCFVPRDVALEPCAQDEHPNDSPKLCNLFQTDAEPTTALARVGEVALSAESIYFVTSGTDVCKPEQSAIRRISQSKATANVPAAHTCIDESPVANDRRVAGGSLAVLSTDNGDVVFYSGKNTDEIVRCEFELGKKASCKPFASVPSHANGLTIVREGCDAHLFYGTKDVVDGGASFFSISLSGGTSEATPRYAIDPPPPNGYGAAFVKAVEGRLALGIFSYVSPDVGAVFVEEITGVGAEKTLPLANVAFPIDRPLFGLALNRTRVFARTLGSVYSGDDVRGLTGVGPIGANDDEVFAVSCNANTACRIYLSPANASVLSFSSTDIDLDFQEVGGVATDGIATYFPVVPRENQHRVGLLRYWKNPTR